ncbi:GLPGLI family protein [Ichthyenterobacterium magnum]|uniref:GLPGLI family protein n=1 Tax=Ichthyenterobacterium magnum TaxID=1230530 RepID=A0A420DWP0_9FLAO|nr:GLPGLI family protein [Ichthyenterobacterium magnum]RKE98623.1 GLPGLI family protein [Ichthyenterobacterium magnum]
MVWIKNRLVFILVFSVINYCYSQHIVVNYKIITYGDFIEKKTENRNSDVVEKINNSFQLVNLMRMHLKATQTESVYWGDNKVNSGADERYFNLAKLYINNDDIYFTNLKEGIISKSFNAFEKDFVIHNLISNVKWILHKDSKFINKYKCFKATTFYEIKNPKGVFRKEVVAWYTLDIPYRFGPKNFSGLPGLILEVRDDNIIYVADVIEFKAEDIVIEVNAKGENITQKKLDDMAEEAMDNRRKLAKSKRRN